MKLPDFNLQGHVALITGAGRGIGLAIARTLAAAGASVAIQDVAEAIAADEARQIQTEGGRAIGIGGDGRDLTLARPWVDRTIDAFGHIDIVINNLGLQQNGPSFEEYPLEAMQDQLTANVLMTTRLCQEAVPHMVRQAWGRIVNIGSIQGRSGNARMPAYAMSKAAVANLSSGLARRYGRHGITVNCIAPGYIATLRNEAHLKAHPEQSLEWIPLRRIGQPEDHAGLALLLCSNAGSYITGQTIYVDGGMSA